MKIILKFLFTVSIAIIASLIITVWFSPYGKKDGSLHKIMIEKIVIDAETEDVYNYLGNSNHAEDWSIYVDHISTLNQASYKDGKLGSIRRCFKNENESGIYWDEEILIDEANQRRQLSIYNMTNFSISGENLLTEQIYIDKHGKCELSLTLFLDETKSSFLDELKLYYAAYTVSSIFKKNLEEIKNQINLRLSQ